jgi:hypothetical protein
MRLGLMRLGLMRLGLMRLGLMRLGPTGLGPTVDHVPFRPNTFRPRRGDGAVVN